MAIEEGRFTNTKIIMSLVYNKIPRKVDADRAKQRTDVMDYVTGI
jgi:hypothetical protein